MSHEYSQAELAAVFKKLEASPIDRGVEELSRLMQRALPLAGGQVTVYRTVLSNGTAPPSKVISNAQLEFGSI